MTWPHSGHRTSRARHSSCRAPASSGCHRTPDAPKTAPSVPPVAAGGAGGAFLIPETAMSTPALVALRDTSVPLALSLSLLILAAGLIGVLA